MPREGVIRVSRFMASTEIAKIRGVSQTMYFPVRRRQEKLIRLVRRLEGVGSPAVADFQAVEINADSIAVAVFSRISLKKSNWQGTKIFILVKAHRKH